MCLSLITRDYCIAREDIIVYKVLEKGCDGYYSPYRRSYVDITKGQQAIIEEKSDLFIDIGIHCFTHLFFAMAVANIQRNVLFKCYIPKGTKYYIGSDDDIVCEDLRYIEEIKIIEGITYFDCIINRRCMARENKVNFLLQSDKDLKVGETYQRIFMNYNHVFGFTNNYILSTGFHVEENKGIGIHFKYDYLVEIPKGSVVIVNNNNDKIIFSDTVKIIEKCA